MRVEVPFFLFVILQLSRLRFSARATLFAAAAVAVPYMLVSYWIVANWQYVIYAYPALDLTYRTADILLMALAALCLTRQRIVQSLFIIASAYVVITVTEVLAVACLLAAGIPELAAKCVLYLVMSLLIYRARRPFTGILRQTKKGWWLLCSVPLFLIVNFLLVSAIPVTLSQNPRSMPAALILCGTTIIIYITFFYLMWEQHKQNQLENNVMALRLSVSALEHQNELIQENERHAALLRHDLRHFAGLMQDCLDRNDQAGIRKLLSTVITQDSNDGNGLRLAPVCVYMGHTMLDAVLYRYHLLAKEAGVAFTIRTDPAEALRADKTELAVVLSNALENAVTACRAIPPEKPRAIRLDGRRRGAQYFLEIVNTYHGDLLINPDTGLPENNTRRGLGCQSIAFFAQQYGAVLQFQAEDGWFHMRMLM